jgi:CubicO group peptidase (beta-lactamase class C family)
MALLLALGAAVPARSMASEATEEDALEAFLDEVVPAQLAAYRIPGATVAVVREGRVVARGYGQADAGRGTPVVAERTLFRVASLGKPFVWTAVMQLAEQGRLELDADVWGYLEATDAPPLTLTHLMAHTAGFEARERLWPSGPMPDSLAEYLRQRLPARVRPPGELSAYSDYGTSLAMHLVERVSGKPFEVYLRENLFEPLGMRRSHFGRRVPPEFADDMALGHVTGATGWRAQSVEEVVVQSGGSLSTTATDLARFMLAHLQGGQHEGRRILGEETVRRMHRQHFTHAPGLSGWAHGFMEFHLNGQRLIGHKGDAYRFISLMALMPEHGTGLFVSYNGLGEKNAAQRARMELLKAFLDRYHPAPPSEPPAALKDFALRAGRFEGGYQTTWRAYVTAEASLAWRQEVRVREGGEGTLRIQEPGGAPRRWVEVAPRLFRPLEEPSSPERVLFREDARGNITHLFFQNRPEEAWERAPWYETSRFTLGLLAGCAALFALSVLGGALWRSPDARWLAAIGLLNLLCLAGFTLLVRHPHAFGEDGSRLLLGGARTCALVAAMLTPVALVTTTRAWWTRTGRRAWRLHLTGATLAATLFVAWLYHWNLLGP